MKPKAFAAAVSAVVLALALFCPLQRLAESLGWVSLPEMGNIVEPEREYGNPFLDAAEQVKAEIAGTYINNLPFYAEAVAGIKTAVMDFNRPFNTWLASSMRADPAPAAVPEEEAAEHPDAVNSLSAAGDAPETEDVSGTEDAPVTEIGPETEEAPAAEGPAEPEPASEESDEPCVLSSESTFLNSSAEGINLYSIEARMSDGSTVELLTSAFNTPEKVYEKRMRKTAETINEIAALAPDVRAWVYVCSRLQDAACFSDIVPGEPSTGPLVDEFFSLLDEGITYDRLKIDSLDDSIRKLFLTDHHWNAYGMYEAYCDMVAMMFGEDAQIRPMGDRYDVEGAAYYGTFARTSGYYGAHDDFFFYDYHLPKHRLIADNPYDFESVRDRYLSGDFSRDRGADHYVAFYPYAQYLKYPENDTGRVLLLLGDSYSRGISELLSSAFDEAYIFDYRRISQIGDYRAYVEKHGITDVLFMQYSLRGVFDNQNDNTLETLLP